MKIRPATTEDAAAIARVHIRSWREAFSPIMTNGSLKEAAYGWPDLEVLAR